MNISAEENQNPIKKITVDGIEGVFIPAEPYSFLLADAVNSNVYQQEAVAQFKLNKELTAENTSLHKKNQTITVVSVVAVTVAVVEGVILWK